MHNTTEEAENLEIKAIVGDEDDENITAHEKIRFIIKLFFKKLINK